MHSCFELKETDNYCEIQNSKPQLDRTNEKSVMLYRIKQKTSKYIPITYYTERTIYNQNNRSLQI